MQGTRAQDPGGRWPYKNTRLHCYRVLCASQLLDYCSATHDTPSLLMCHMSQFNPVGVHAGYPWLVLLHTTHRLPGLCPGSALLWEFGILFERPLLSHCDYSSSWLFELSRLPWRRPKCIYNNSSSNNNKRSKSTKNSNSNNGNGKSSRSSNIKKKNKKKCKT